MNKIELPQPLRVLLIEDEDIFAQFVTHVLDRYQPLNFIVCRKASMKETQEATEPQAHVVILDLKLPNGEGLALIEKVYAMTRLPILVLTGHDFAENEAIAWGAQEFLRKQDLREGGLDKLPVCVIRAFVRGKVLPNHAEAHQQLQVLSKAISETAPPTKR